TLGLLASSPKGSPGASASTVNSTMLMPIRLGIAISRRLTRYRLMRALHSCVAVPVLQIPEVVVPAGSGRVQFVGHGLHLRPIDDRDHRLVAHEVVHADE